MKKAMLLLSLLLPFGVQAQPALPQPKGEILLRVSGAIKVTNSPGGAAFDREMLRSLGEVTLKTTTAFTDGENVFVGVPLKTVLDRVGASGTEVVATALNAYTERLPLEDLRYEPLLAMTMDGVPMTARDKGPIWIVYPRDKYAILRNANRDRYWVWQLNSLRVE
jgi:hypothetical protein